MLEQNWICIALYLAQEARAFVLCLVMFGRAIFLVALKCSEKFLKASVCRQVTRDFSILTSVRFYMKIKILSF